jgi:hypothetical protein
MSKRTISEDSYNQWRINRDNKTWTLEQQASISVDGEAAIDVTVTSTGNTLKLLGDISASSFFGRGVQVSGADTKILIGTHSTIDAEIGIQSLASADGLHIVNRGKIDSGGAGISSNADTSIMNFGEIDGNVSIAVHGEAKIINGRDGVVHGSTVAVSMNGSGSALINHGEIGGSGDAVRTYGSGDYRVVNTGTMVGDIFFRDGNDLLDSRKGTFEGDVIGGDGNDIYKIGKNNIDIVEEADGGHDSVYSKITYSLDDHVETLHLVGKSNVSGIGNSWDNMIFGNKGDNTLSGGSGDDYVGGALGNDHVNGGSGGDVFMFNRGDDHDVVDDFAKGEDIVWMTGFNGVTTFAKLQSHISQHGDDAWISMGKGDRLVIRDTDADQLEADDFSFLTF